MPVPLAPQPLRILVVDDRRDSVLFLKTLLSRAGHDVLTADNGADGIEAARRSLPDVVVSDLGLDGSISGYVLAREVLADPSIPTPQFIAITGYDDDEHRQLAREAGFTHYLVKPAPIDQLLDLLAGMSRRAKPQA